MNRKIVFGILSIRQSVFLSLFAISPLKSQPPEIDLAAASLAGHSKLPQNNPHGRDLREAIRGAKSNALNAGVIWQGLSVVVPDSPADAPASHGDFQSFFRDLTCRADAVIAGNVTASLSHLSDSAAGVYSDHVFSIDTVVKDDVSSSMRTKRTVIVTRLGGDLMIDTDPIHYDYESFPPFRQNTEYLLFLRRLPTGAYQAVDGLSTFSLENDRWLLARRAFKLDSPELGGNRFRSSISTWSGQCRNN